MKKLLLVSAAIAISAGSFAQSSFKNDHITFSPSMQAKSATISNNIDMDDVAGKSTATSDTAYDFLTLAMQKQIFDSSAFYVLGSLPADSGAFFGPNSSGFNAFAEWFNPGTYLPDTTMQIVGAVSRWGGTVQPNSLKTISYKMWTINALTNTASDSDNFISETPGVATFTQIDSITNLMMDTALTIEWFVTAQPVTGPFYMGYEPNFLFAPALGDTIGLYSTRNGYSWFHGVVDTIINNGGGDMDTVYFAQTCYRQGVNWNDVWVNNIASVNLSIMPIYRYEGGNVFPAEVANVGTKLAVYGNYPNPANDQININFGLANASEVKVQIMDITGRTLSTTTFGKMKAGANTVSVSTSGLAAGNYVYMISSNNGGAIAAQFTVAK